MEEECFDAEKRSGIVWTTTETVNMRHGLKSLLTTTNLRDILFIDSTLDITNTSTINCTPNASKFEPYSANNTTLQIP